MCSIDRDGVRALRKGRTASQDGREDLVQNAGPYRLHGSVAHEPGGPMPRTIGPRVAGRVQATLDTGASAGRRAEKNPLNLNQIMLAEEVARRRQWICVSL